MNSTEEIDRILYIIETIDDVLTQLKSAYWKCLASTYPFGSICMFFRRLCGSMSCRPRSFQFCLKAFRQLAAALLWSPLWIASIRSSPCGIDLVVRIQITMSIRGRLKRWRKSCFILRQCDPTIIVVFKTGISSRLCDQAHNIHWSNLYQFTKRYTQSLK